MFFVIVFGTATTRMARSRAHASAKAQQSAYETTFKSPRSRFLFWSALHSTHNQSHENVRFFHEVSWIILWEWRRTHFWTTPFLSIWKTEKKKSDSASLFWSATKIELLLPWDIPHPFNTFHGDLSSSFCVIISDNRKHNLLHCCYCDVQSEVFVMQK